MKDLDGVIKTDYAKQKATLSHEELFKDVDDLSYGQPTKLSQEGVERMVKELEKRYVHNLTTTSICSPPSFSTTHLTTLL